MATSAVAGDGSNGPSGLGATDDENYLSLMNYNNMPRISIDTPDNADPGAS